MRKRRVGLLGGTFDPPHHGHLIVGADAFEWLELHLLLLVPAASPPHKPAGARATAEQRLRMVEAAVAGDPRFGVDDLELRRPGPSYTVDTLRELTRREPDAELVFLLGIDQFREFESWREPHEVARLARLGILSRKGDVPDVAGPYGGIHVPVTRIDISATAIRRRVAAGQSIRYLVPEPVREIIEAEGIYK
jgi:nicotinate-nucleotide adenylyltransferase